MKGDEGKEINNIDDKQLEVILSPEVPVAGCEINASVRFNSPCHSLNEPHYFSFTWYREQIACCIHECKPATVQCISCVKLKIPSKWSYFCSGQCLSDAWQKHQELHSKAVKDKITDQETMLKVRSCGSWHDLNSLLSDENSEITVERGDMVKLGDSKSYIAMKEDIGYYLLLETAVLGQSTGSQLFPSNVIRMDPVIPSPVRIPRSMIQVGSHLDSQKNNPKAHNSVDVRFSVLTYNVLAQLFVRKDRYKGFPGWALSWEYRRENLLREIVDYNADIICLQEVQMDHFGNFFEPKLRDYGYSVRYKAKNNKMYTGSGYTIDGCATFYRHDLFKEITTYELDFDKMALSTIEEAMNPENKSYARLRLVKDNVALVVLLEALSNCDTNYSFPHRLCVANTHIFANREFPDVKLLQVANLVYGLEKISEHQVPLLVCGDFNCLPNSDPHKFLVRGEINSLGEEKEADPFGIRQFLNLHHSLPLRSAYASLFTSDMMGKPTEVINYTNEPLFTHMGRRATATLDYILYTEDSLCVEGLLELLDIVSVENGMPSPLWSSDHVALMASFRMNNGYRLMLRSPLSIPSNPWQQSSNISVGNTCS